VAGDPGRVIEVFTSRVDTLMGVTAVVLSCKHPIVEWVVNSNGSMLHLLFVVDVGIALKVEKQKK
jgi:leucyl-tRNA synthetase